MPEPFEDAVARVQAAATKMTTGEGKPYIDAWSHADDVSLMGAWGGHEVGWPDLEERFGWVAKRFGGGSAMTYEQLLSYESSDLAYTVGIEHGQAMADGALTPMALRVTHIYRRQVEEWKLVHRHADFATEKQEPPS
jgi:ketosteroid isomerase-like protein